MKVGFVSLEPHLLDFETLVFVYAEKLQTTNLESGNVSIPILCSNHSSNQNIAK
jgi:hypothetical protein